MTLDSYYAPVVTAIHERYADSAKAKEIVYALHDDKSLEKYAMAAMRRAGLGADEDSAVEQFLADLVYPRFGKPEDEA